LSRAFSPDKYKYIMLMMVDAHLHSHVIARYQTAHNFLEKEWKDSGWPTLPQLADGEDLQTDPLLIAIRDRQ